jgi:hypothetical protein
VVITAWMFGAIGLPHRDEAVEGRPIFKSDIHATFTKVPLISTVCRQCRTFPKFDLPFLGIIQAVGTIFAEPGGAMKCAMLRAVPIFDVAVQLPCAQKPGAI